MEEAQCGTMEGNEEPVEQNTDLSCCSTNSSTAITTDDDGLQKQRTLSSMYVAFLKQLSGSWSSHGAAKMLTPDLILYIRPRFHRCSTPLKVRILTSLLYLPPELLQQCLTPLSQLLHSCETDRDDWVRKLSRLLQPYVMSGHLDVRDIDTETAYRVIKYLDQQRQLTVAEYRLKPPLEHSKVFNILEDSPVIVSSRGDPNSSSTSQPFQALWAELLGSDHADALPPYQPETQHFRCNADFSLFMRDTQAAGLTVLVRELQASERQRRPRGRRADKEQDEKLQSDAIPFASPRANV